MLGALPPAPCQWYFSQLGLLIDLVVRALAEVLPKQAAGASYGDSMVIGFSGIDHRNDQPFFDLEPTVGGWGAWDGSDGQDGLINNVNGSLKDLPIEVLETKFPMRMTHYGFRPDTGGPGQWRGGNGVVRVHARRRGGRAVALVRALADARLGTLRRPRRRAAGRRDQPGPRGRAPPAEGEPPAASAGRRRTDDDRRRRRFRRSSAA